MQIAPTVTSKLYDSTHTEIQEILEDAGIPNGLVKETAERIFATITPAAYNIIRTECIACDKQLKFPF